MTNKTPHPHAELIAEWIKDTSRVVQFKTESVWVDAFEPLWHHNIEYRFKPEEPPKPVIVSSLTDDELARLAENEDWYNSPNFFARTVADTAAQRAIEDLKVPDLAYFDGIYAFGTDSFYLRLSVNTYLQDLKKGEL